MVGEVKGREAARPVLSRVPPVWCGECRTPQDYDRGAHLLELRAAE